MYKGVNLLNRKSQHGPWSVCSRRFYFEDLKFPEKFQVDV